MEKRYKNSISLLLHWAGKDKYWLYLAILFSVISGLCTMVPYYGIYRLMEAGFQGNLTTNFVIQNALIIAVAMVIRFIFSEVQVLHHIKGLMAHCLRCVAWLLITWRRFHWRIK